MNLRAKCLRLIESLGLGRAKDVTSIEELSGGVSSELAMVELGDRRVCAKFSLPKLRVAENWYAPVSRNKAEYDWLSFAQHAAPGSTPQLLGRDPEINGFAMEFIAQEDAYLWKASLLDRATMRDEGRIVGDTLGRIHAASSRPDFDSEIFQNQSNFCALRLEPYLEYTATRHSDLAQQLRVLVRSLKARSDILVHGDVSPKNIFFRGRKCIILDAECATMGDACFDLAFCMNHLVLKAFHMPDRSTALLAELHGLWETYATRIEWEEAGELESRTCKLLPALMLARIDGKSPVEYLAEDSRHRVLISAIELLRHPRGKLAELTEHVQSACGP